MPYRIDLHAADDGTFDRLVELGAIDAEDSPAGGIAALMPDSVAPEQVAAALGIGIGVMSVSSASGRDDGSVWVLRPRPIRVGRLRIVPVDAGAGTEALGPGDLGLIDASAFGTGLHPTTVLCLDVIENAVRHGRPDAVLDVGTGSGVLALAALLLGVPHAVGIDIDEEALRVAAENARVNAVADRLRLARGGPDAVTEAWPLVLANIQAGPLIEMAPALVRRVGHHGQLVLSGIAASVEPDVHLAYRRLGMRRLDVKSRAGWVALVLQASW